MSHSNKMVAKGRGDHEPLLRSSYSTTKFRGIPQSISGWCGVDTQTSVTNTAASHSKAVIVIYHVSGQPF